MSLFDNNILLNTDVYKMGHMEQYPPGTTKIYSYLCARSDKTIPYVVFYGLQYYLHYLKHNAPYGHDIIEFLRYRQDLLGTKASGDIVDKLMKLEKLHHLPLSIKAIPEGTVVRPARNVLMTITNTHPDFAWLVGFVESLLLKVWNTCTVASYSRMLKERCTNYAVMTCDDDSHVPFQVHDFGYRGCSSEETAALSGSAHLVNFLGTDTVPALKLIDDTYGPASRPLGLSVPASEHSVMCAYGPEGEFKAFEHLLDTYPSGILSIVSDTYDLWKVLKDFAPRLKDRILAREGKVVFRPDSGVQEQIIPVALEMLAAVFGCTTNSKGFKVLNPKVGLIYGEGFTYDKMAKVLCVLKECGWASSNLVMGIGGLLLQSRSRDEQGFAIKATYAEIDGIGRTIYKDPVTDREKKSHKGLMALRKTPDGLYETIDRLTWEAEGMTELVEVFRDGEILKEWTFDEIRERAKL